MEQGRQSWLSESVSKSGCCLFWVPCSAPYVSYKAWPAALVLSASSSSLPLYHAPVILPVVQQYAWFAPIWTQLHVYVRMFENLYQPLNIVFFSQWVVIPIGTGVKQDLSFLSSCVMENGRVC